jgi:hypothetical protein
MHLWAHVGPAAQRKVIEDFAASRAVTAAGVRCISHEAVALIRLRGDAVPKGCPFLFPGDLPGQPVVDLKRFWERPSSERMTVWLASVL